MSLHGCRMAREFYQPGTCGNGFTCAQIPADAPWFSRPEWFRLEK
ncbi:MAG TPA: hypothetical protein VNA24_32855 [Hyalangium sp.]|nr:hypothetical protein [Hyalangium sp.]